MRSASKRARLLELMAARGWDRVGEAEWNVLTVAIPKFTTSDLRHAGVPAEPPWSGVAQKTFEELEASLRALGEVYGTRQDLRRFCRREVIRAKDRARLASRNVRLSEDKRREKSEMVEWMLVWLGDPALFPAWSELRRQMWAGARLAEAPARRI